MTTTVSSHPSLSPTSTLAPAPAQRRLTRTLEVRPGEGGDDAECFAAELLTALTTAATRRGCEVVIDPPGARTRTASVRGHVSALEELTSLTGLHRIQRVPANARGGRRHTSTASAVLLDPKAPPEVALLDADLVIQTYRGTGAGGQKKNKTSSAVRMRHLPSGITVTREHGRSLTQNLEDARADILSQLRAQAGEEATRARNLERRTQVAAADRSAKSFTHNTQRDSSVCHEDGRSWPLGAFLRGRI